MIALQLGVVLNNSAMIMLMVIMTKMMLLFVTMKIRTVRRRVGHG